MGFFKDFKEDLSQAVNEIVTDTDNEKAVESKDDDVMVNTLDDAAISAMAANIEEKAMSSIEETVAEESPAELKKAEKMTAVSSELEIEEDEAVDETAIITKGLSVTGDLNSKGSIEIFGVVEGNVNCKGKLTVCGTISGNSKAAEVFANNAQVDGDVEAAGSVKIGQGSVVVGNIKAMSAVIAGAVKGDIDIHGPVIIDASAVIVGDIKSKSVQINNGATIEGRCSQCYADVNPTSVFEKKKK